jgi:hypothetical protein
MYDIQTALNSGHAATLPEGVTQLSQSVRLPAGGTVRGAGMGLSVVEVLTPNIDAFIVESAGETRAHATISDLAVRTLQPGVTGIRSTWTGANAYRDLVFQGMTYTVNIDCGRNHWLDRLISEPWGARPAGSLLLGSSDSGQYGHYIDVQGYHVIGPCGMPPVIIRRATNVDAMVHIHEPGTDGILVTDDSQGVMLSGDVVKAVNGVVLSGVDGRRPSFVDLRRLKIDQSGSFGVLLIACTDIDVGGQITNGNQGIEIGSYPAVERVKIDSRLAMHLNNGIVTLPGARYWSVVGASACGTGGAAVVVSNGNADDFTVADNDFSQGNGARYIGPTASPTRVVAGNR